MGAPSSRRAFLSLLPGALAAQITPSEQRRFRDPATEFELARHTDPRANAWLPNAAGRAFSHKLGGLLYCSDRTGSPQAYRLDLKTGESRQLTDADGLDPATFTCTPDDRGFCYFDGSSLVLHHPKPHTVYTSEAGWNHGWSLAVSSDGSHAAFVEDRGRQRLRVIALPRGPASTLLETNGAISDLRMRPKRRALLYRTAGALWTVDFDGRNHRRLKTATGIAGPASWSADGDTLVYLNFPEERGRLNQLRELAPDSDEDRPVAPTSQFVQFARNGDSSMFAGVSGSKASPFILLLSRATRRELTMAEHRASDANKVVVTFSPNSQRLFYHTDREGRFAIYSLALEKFVEKTET